jgi:hypothetical protein
MREKKGKTYERAPWRGVSSWSSFHPTRVAREAGVGGGVIPVVRRVSSAVVRRVSSTVVRRVSSPIVRRVSSPVIRRRSTRDPPHEQLLMRLGRVVHRCMSSIVVVPGRLSFPHRLSSVVPSVVRCCCCCCCCRMALVHPQSTRRAVARQRGGGCSVDRHRRPHRRCSLFVVVVPVRRRRPCSSSSSPSSSFVVRRRRPRRRHSSFVVVRPSIPIPHPPVGCSSSSVVHPLVPPAVHPTSSCS